MTDKEQLLTIEERTVLEKLALEPGVEGKRAAALLLLDGGASQAVAAEQTGLTKGQVQYILKKFRSQRLLAFPSALGLLPPDPAQPPIEEKIASNEKEGETGTRESHEEPSTQLGRLLVELDNLVDALRNSIPDAAQTPYSPLRMLTLVRSSISRYTPDVQINILEQFEDMTREDLMDLDTWKGLAYMIAYSAQFQATQTKDKLNDQLPEPVKPDSIFAIFKGGLDRITPDIARQIASSFEGATREDLLDLDTWKGVWYMLNYSLQFQAEQIKLRLMGGEEEE
jgi:hypothetical protein